MTCFIWSTLWLFIKLGLRDLPPITFGGIRLLIALAVLMSVLAMMRQPLLPRLRDWKLIALTGIPLLGLNYALVFWGTQYIPSGMAAVLQSTTAMFGLFHANYFLGERITLTKLCALEIGVAGVALIFSNQLQVVGWSALLGCIAVVSGSFCVSIGYVLVKTYGAHLQPSVLTTGQMLCSAPILLVLGFVREGNPFKFNWTTTAVFSLLYIALAGSVVAFQLNYWLLKRLEPTKVLVISIVEPLLATLLGVVVLGELLTGRTLLGGILILFSMGILLTRSKLDSKPAGLKHNMSEPSKAFNPVVLLDSPLHSINHTTLPLSAERKINTKEELETELIRYRCSRANRY